MHKPIGPPSHSDDISREWDRLINALIQPVSDISQHTSFIVIVESMLRSIICIHQLGPLFSVLTFSSSVSSLRILQLSFAHVLMIEDIYQPKRNVWTLSRFRTFDESHNFPNQHKCSLVLNAMVSNFCSLAVYVSSMASTITDTAKQKDLLYFCYFATTNRMISTY